MRGRGGVYVHNNFFPSVFLARNFAHFHYVFCRIRGCFCVRVCVRVCGSIVIHVFAMGFGSFCCCCGFVCHIHVSWSSFLIGVVHYLRIYVLVHLRFIFNSNAHDELHSGITGLQISLYLCVSSVAQRTPCKVLSIRASRVSVCVIYATISRVICFRCRLHRTHTHSDPR